MYRYPSCYNVCHVLQVGGKEGIGEGAPGNLDGEREGIMSGDLPEINLLV